MSKNQQRIIVCAQCFFGFYASPSRIKRGQKFCSRICKDFNHSIIMKGRDRTQLYKEKMSLVMRGKNNPAFRHGKHSLIERIRNSKAYADWRMKVFSRDNFTCSICKNYGGSLEAHHLKSFSKMILDLRCDDFDKIIKLKALWDIGLAITLCKKCHAKTDNFGFKGWLKKGYSEHEADNAIMQAWGEKI